jgi:hypothetical protein
LPFSEHVYRLCLDFRLYSATIKLQSDMGLGKAYAGMLPFVEGLHSLGYLQDEDYELYRNKYSVSLEDAHNNKNKSPVQILKEQSRANYRRTQNDYFGEALKQWAHMKPKAKKYYLKKASDPENKTLKNAKLLLELGEQDRERLTLES